MSLLRHELTDAQWKLGKDLLPAKASDLGRTADDNRLLLDVVLSVLKSGIPWADLPERYGKPIIVWKRFDRWSPRCISEKIAKTLSDPDLEEIQQDSSSVKAHPVSSTRRRQPAEKRRGRRAALPGTQSGRTDDETPLCRERMRIAPASASDTRSTGRCSASEAPGE